MLRLMAALAAGVLALAGCNGDDGGGPGGSAADFCGFAEDIERIDELGEGIDPTDFGAFSDQLDEFNELLDDAVSAAPAEIRDDVELVATSVSETFEAMRGPLQELSENPEAAAQNPEIFQALEDAAPGPEEQAELEEASQRIEAFVEDECGIEIEDEDLGDDVPNLEEELPEGISPEDLEDLENINPEDFFENPPEG